MSVYISTDVPSTVSEFISTSTMVGGIPLAPIPTIVIEAFSGSAIPIPDT